MYFQIAAILILLAFYGTYFAKMLAQKKQGIETNQMGKGKTGLPKYIEIIMKIASIAVPPAELICIVTNTAWLPGPARWLGILLGIIGDTVFLLSVLTMKDSWRAGVPETDKTELVTEGIYQLSRNPAFLGFDLVYLGILLIFFHPVLLLLSVFAMLMFHLQIVNVEEPFLLLAFGDEYLSYQKQVRRYLGRKLHH